MTISRFYEKDIGLLDVRAGWKQRVVVAPEIAGKYDLLALIIAFDEHLGNRRSQHVSGRIKPDRHTLVQRDLHVEIEFLYQRENGLGVGRVVQRLRMAVLGIS